jgi:hypothetical protein
MYEDGKTLNKTDMVLEYILDGAHLLKNKAWIKPGQIWIQNTRYHEKPLDKHKPPAKDDGKKHISQAYFKSDHSMHGLIYMKPGVKRESNTPFMKSFFGLQFERFMSLKIFGALVPDIDHQDTNKEPKKPTGHGNDHGKKKDDPHSSSSSGKKPDPKKKDPPKSSSSSSGPGSSSSSGKKPGSKKKDPPKSSSSSSGPSSSSSSGKAPPKSSSSSSGPGSSSNSGSNSGPSAKKGKRILASKKNLHHDSSH